MTLAQISCFVLLPIMGYKVQKDVLWWLQYVVLWTVTIPPHTVIYTWFFYDMLYHFLHDTLDFSFSVFLAFLDSQHLLAYL